MTEVPGMQNHTAVYTTIHTNKLLWRTQNAWKQWRRQVTRPINGSDLIWIRAVLSYSWKHGGHPKMQNQKYWHHIPCIHTGIHLQRQSTLLKPESYESDTLTTRPLTPTLDKRQDLMMRVTVCIGWHRQLFNFFQINWLTDWIVQLRQIPFVENSCTLAQLIIVHH